MHQGIPGAEQVPNLQVMNAGGIPTQDLGQDPYMTNFADDTWLSAIFMPWDSMNF